jgi:hypothetical protein
MAWALECGDLLLGIEAMAANSSAKHAAAVNMLRAICLVNLLATWLMGASLTWW